MIKEWTKERTAPLFVSSTNYDNNDEEDKSSDDYWVVQNKGKRDLYLRYYVDFGHRVVYCCTYSSITWWNVTICGFLRWKNVGTPVGLGLAFANCIQIESFLLHVLRYPNIRLKSSNQKLYDTWHHTVILIIFLRVTFEENIGNTKFHYWQ